MTICKYFQQGTCRFGNRCRFEHVFVDDGGSGDGGYSAAGGTSIFNRNKTPGQFSSFFAQPVPQQTRPTAPIANIRDLVQSVTTELMQSERGGQWPLSCFAPFKEHGCFPGLEDHSPEELRYLIYEAVKSNTLEECTRKINELYERNRSIKKQILNPNSEVYSVIEKLFKGQKVDSFSNTLFTSQPGIAGNSLLSQTPVSTNFTFTIPAVGGDASNNFGGSQMNFNNPGGSITHSSSIFAVPLQPSAGPIQSVFGGGTGQTPAVPPFGNIPQPNSGFQQSSVGDFSSPFLNQQNKGIFTGNDTNQNKSIFGNNSVNRGVFGSDASWNQGNKEESGSAVFSLLSELTEEEKNIFNSKTFTMGKVPIKAPAKELCL